MDLVCVFAEQSEEVGVFAGLPFEYLVWARGVVRIVLFKLLSILAALRPRFASRHYVDIQLRYHHLEAITLYKIDCRL